VKLTTYLESLTPDARRDFARRCQTSLEYLRQVAAGIRTPKVQLAVAISRESGGMVPVQAVMPGVDWDYLREALQVPVERAA